MQRRNNARSIGKGKHVHGLKHPLNVQINLVKLLLLPQIMMMILNVDLTLVTNVQFLKMDKVV